ncbi:MAG: Mov34/MPN/PAD-1 family protein [Acidobacteria bacterium]|nr:Mov34/MPN/PAD-1 family protein [Acidobacteriota bacterium]
MQLLLPTQVTKRLRQELRRAKAREIGGLLMGEHVRDDVFRAVDISVQRSGGSQIHFVRDPSSHATQLDAFFARTGNDFTRFNYLGEWHSHPTFDPAPSSIDCDSMQSIVDNPDVGVNFLVLLVVKLAGRQRIAGTATVFRPLLPSMSVVVLSEDIGPGSRFERALPSWLRGWFTR